MADASTDVLMRVVGPKGPLDAESTTVFSAATDNLRLGFLPNKFCELREFSFSAGIASAMSKKKTKGEEDEDEEEEGAKPGAGGKKRAKSTKPSKAAPGDETVDIQPVEYTRTMDCMSTRLFQSLVDCDTLETISIIKRKAAGVTSSGLTYLRLDFNKVLMTALDWKDGEHVILESGSFIYRSVTIRYRPQLKDGTLGTVIQQEWTMPAPQG